MNDSGGEQPADRHDHQIGSTSTLTKTGTTKPGVIQAFVVIISSLMISNVIYHLILADTFTEQLSSPSGIVLFFTLSAIPYGGGYYLIRKFIGPLNKQAVNGVSGSQRYFRITYKILLITFFYNAVLLAIITYQIIVSSQYNVGLTVLSMQANAVFPVIIGAFLGYKFMSWYRSSHDTVLLFFGATFVLIAVGFVATDVAQTASFVLDDSSRTEGLHEIQNSEEGIGYYQLNNFKEDPLYHNLFMTTSIPLRIAFFPYWIATSLLLRKYSKRIGRLRYWLLVSLPLATYTIATIFIFGSYGTQLLRGIVMSTAQFVGGILFSLIFLTISRALRNGPHTIQSSTDQGERRSTSTKLASYLMMSAFGTILYLIIATPPNHIIDWIHTPYPPFANVVWSFMGFATYLYGFGLYFSTVAISQDTRLRRSIHKLAMEEADFLQSLGTTRMKEELQKKVARLSKEQEEILKEQTGVEQKVTEEEMKQYMEEVMREINKASSRI